MATKEHLLGVPTLKNLTIFFSKLIFNITNITTLFIFLLSLNWISFLQLKIKNKSKIIQNIFLREKDACFFATFYKSVWIKKSRFFLQNFNWVSGHFEWAFPRRTNVKWERLRPEQRAEMSREKTSYIRQSWLTNFATRISNIYSRLTWRLVRFVQNIFILTRV